MCNEEHYEFKENLKQLPFCGDEIQRLINRKILYVSTLDGRISALDILNNGNKIWSIYTEPGSLISSNIHQLELTNNGQWVRMIPSLNGGLYKFDGETVDPIPITVDDLLSSSFKFSDDLVISGGKETRSYGVSTRTGQTLYECSMHGCVNSTNSVVGKKVNQKNQNSQKNKFYENVEINEHNPLIDDVIIVRRQTQVVRAIEPRTGSERWNFSVGFHELELVENIECLDKSMTQTEMKILDIDIKIIVPEGIVLAFNKNNLKDILWKFQFDHPIVSVWRSDKNSRIQNVDIFNDSVRWLLNGGEENFSNLENWISPSIYLGMYQKQLYIQESSNLLNTLIKKKNLLEKKNLNDEANVIHIPWKPILAKRINFPLLSSGNKIESKNDVNIINDNKIKENDETETNENEENTAVIATSVLHASEYVNGNGYFLFSNINTNKTNNAFCNTNNSTITNKESEEEFNFEDINNEPVQIIIVSLWFWWKELVVLSLTSALVLNLFITPRIRREREVVVIERHIPVPTAIEATEESLSNSRSSQRSLSESNSNDSNGEFRSRFLTDFDLVQCLGKGGFGVVFEAKNKIDDCNYAVKRISLPNKRESRDRVMREVKTLANCEHQNIVRYFQAWIENPPPGWQEEEDRKWMEKDMLSTSIDIETPDGSVLPPFPTNTWDSTKRETKISNDDEFTKNNKLDFMKPNKSDKSFFKGCEDSLRYLSNNYEDDSLSFIQFKSDTKDKFEHDINGYSKNAENGYSKNATALNNSNFSRPKTINNTSDSLEIEFKEYSKNDSNEKNNCSNNCVAKLKHHKRQFSLNLSSKGNVIIPISAFSSQNQIQNKVYLYIQMQLCRKQSLKDWLREHKTEMRQPHIQNIFQQIIDAVGYVHLKGLIHRDLKPSNIFFSLNGQIKIGDFGLVTDMPQSTPPPPMNLLSSEEEKQVSGNGILHSIRYTQKVGTHLYMSPEQLKGLPYDYKVDIYSLGLIFFELLVYFSTESERIKTFLNLREGKFPHDFPEKFPNQHKLLNLMLSITPDERPTTFQIKEKLNNMNLWLPHLCNQSDNENSFHLEYKTTTKCVSEISSSS